MFSRQQVIEFLVERGYHVTRIADRFRIESSDVNVHTGLPTVDLDVDGSGLDDFAVSICRGENGSIV